MFIKIKYTTFHLPRQGSKLYNATMHIAILGGSFDPPHNGHAKIAESVIAKLNFDQVWLMPCFAHAFGKTLLAASGRMAMTILLETKTIQALDYEIQKGGISISYETLTDLAKLHPHHSFSWIIGSDQIADFPKWEGWREIISKFGLIIVQRDSLHLSTLQDVTFLQSNNIPNVSSTEIREKIKKGNSIENLVPKRVEEYIKKHKLYI